jgi:hypothetical protein
MISYSVYLGNGIYILLYVYIHHPYMFNQFLQLILQCHVASGFSISSLIFAFCSRKMEVLTRVLK